MTLLNQYKYKIFVLTIIYTIFMNLENSKTSKLHVLIFNLTDKIDLRRGEKMLLYQILVFIRHGKK